MPPNAVLPILNNVINNHPALKAEILASMPAPSLDVATAALNQAAKKLRDAYPFHQSALASPFSVGWSAPRSNFSQTRPHSFSGALPGSTSMSSPESGRMRDEYVLDRLKPHIPDFVRTCLMYIPFFSSISRPQLALGTPSASLRQREMPHPTTSFTFLSMLTEQYFAQPALARPLIAAQLLPRLTLEWKAWMARVDNWVNQEGKMVGQRDASTWFDDLEKFISYNTDGSQMLREIRDESVRKFGWLAGRRPSPTPMEEL